MGAHFSRKAKHGDSKVNAKASRDLPKSADIAMENNIVDKDDKGKKVDKGEKDDQGKKTDQVFVSDDEFEECEADVEGRADKEGGDGDSADAFMYDVIAMKKGSAATPPPTTTRTSAAGVLKSICSLNKKGPERNIKSKPKALAAAAAALSVVLPEEDDAGSSPPTPRAGTPKGAQIGEHVDVDHVVGEFTGHVEADNV